jgi:hypothetical protein
MATATLSSVADKFPVGTTVTVYPLSNWPTGAQPPAGAPIGSSTTTAVVASAGSLAFTGLTDDTRYVATASVGGTYRYLNFITARTQSVAGTLRRIAIGYQRFDATAITTGQVVGENFAVSGSNAAAGKAAFYFDPDDYAVAGSSTKLVLRMSILTNDTAPTSTFTASLAPLTAPAGAAANVTVSIGTNVTGSTAAIVAPLANTANVQESDDFDPPTAGQYALRIAISAYNMAANSAASARIELFARNV